MVSDRLSPLSQRAAAKQLKRGTNSLSLPAEYQHFDIPQIPMNIWSVTVSTVKTLDHGFILNPRGRMKLWFQ